MSPAPSSGRRTRRTRQRDAIRRAFAAVDRPIGPEECLELARRSVPRLGIATVYRNIRHLVADGWLRVIKLPGAADRYELAGKRHHHHFHCRSCNGVFEVEGCPGGFTGLAPGGFRLERHEVILYGLCPACGDGIRTSGRTTQVETDRACSEDAPA